MTIELVADGAEAHLDALTRRYTDHPRFYGFVYPRAQRTRETRVTADSRPAITRDSNHR